MIATLQAAKTELHAAQDVGSGNYAEAQTQLATAEQNLREEAARTRDKAAKKKLDDAATTLAVARAHVSATAAAPSPSPAAARSEALDMNKAAMGAMGY
jgi:hypothetical protein